MIRRLSTLVIGLLLVGQGLLAAPGLWHRHGPPGVAVAAVEHGGCHHHATQGHGEPADEPDRDQPAGDDGCAVCLALSTQRIELTAPAAMVAAARLAGRLDVIRVRPPVLADRGPPRSRGPPPFNCA